MSENNEHWALIGFGVFFIILGIFATHGTGPMPGSTLRYPLTLRSRLIMIIGGAVMVVLGAFRLIHK
jgi:hypothetical protein